MQLNSEKRWPRIENNSLNSSLSQAGHAYVHHTHHPKPVNSLSQIAEVVGLGLGIAVFFAPMELWRGHIDVGD
jgi:hypothetical protein